MMRPVPVRILLASCFLAAAVNLVHAQSTAPGGMPPPPGMSLAESAAMRFPQPVRVGDLLGREVLRPVDSQDVLGRVRGLVRDRDGRIMVVVDFGGFLGFGARPIAVLGHDGRCRRHDHRGGPRQAVALRASSIAMGLVIELSLQKVPRPVTFFDPHRTRITRTHPAHGFGHTEAMANFFAANGRTRRDLFDERPGI